MTAGSSWAQVDGEWRGPFWLALEIARAERDRNAGRIVDEFCGDRQARIPTPIRSRFGGMAS